jgi:co-chaperonin GroES (HSP10)
MNKLRPIGKWIEVQTVGGGEKKTSEGIIYTEKINSQLVWSTVISVGDKLTEDVKIGDKVLWDISKIRGQGYGRNNLIHQDWISMVERTDK